jgi:hypothetical protein
VSEVNPRKISIVENRSSQVGIPQIGISQNGIIQPRPIQTGSEQIGISQIGSSQIGIDQTSSTQTNPSQIISFKPVDSLASIDSFRNWNQLNPIKITFPSLVTFQQFIGSNSPNHDDASNYLSQLQSTLPTYWNIPADLNLNFEISNLPTGQLAEATITGYDQLGRPNTATITIDDDANGVGWFLDTTPQDNNEFTGTDTYLQATPNSQASDKYDLLTAILHEMGHTLGFINGYNQFNRNIKGRQFYTDPTHSYTLSSDLSHLDNTLYPNDLLNTNLKPGIRKLPSTMDWAIINAINSGVANGVSSVGTVNPAHLTAGALIGITNGDFTTPTTWNTAGATNIINGTATLTEQSQKLSELTQAFIIPTGAKTLQFTITDNHLIPGDTTLTANDAFEETATEVAAS